MGTVRDRSKARASTKRLKPASNDVPTKSAPARLRTPKQAPPITDCRKCSKIAAARREAATWRRKAERLEADNQARVIAALAGVPIVLSDEEIEQRAKSVYHHRLDEVLAVPRDVALDQRAADADRMRGSQIVAERVLGKVPDKHQVSGGLNLSVTGTLDVIVHPSSEPAE